MRSKIRDKVPALFSFLLFLTLVAGSPHFYRAQQPRSKDEGPLPEALETIINSKQELIRHEFEAISDNEWAGVYRSEESPTSGIQLSWAPAAGFVIRWNTCSYGWRERANYGKAIYQEGSLRLTPELAEVGAHIYSPSSEYIPVLWGEQHFLVPSEQLIAFCYAVKNADNSPEINAFFIKEGDDEKRRKGLPSVPAEYRKYLNSKPINAAILSVKPRPESGAQRITLDAGLMAGVVPRMKFYVSSPRNIFMLVEVVKVGDDSSEAYIITSGVRDNSGSNAEPRVGWKLTSRAPKGASSFYPG